MKKNTMVLITGMMCDERLWQKQLASTSLQKKFDFFTPSMQVFKEDTIEKMAENILKEIPQEKFFATGLSMGGIILMELYRRAKHRILGVVFADTNYKSETKERQLQRHSDLRLVKKMGLKKFVIERMKTKYLSKSAENKESIYKLVVQMAEKLGGEVFEKQSLALKNRRDYKKTIHTIDCPSLILCGEQDGLCPVDRHLEMKNLIPKARLEIIKEAGHLSCLEKPDEFNNSVLKYL